MIEHCFAVLRRTGRSVKYKVKPDIKLVERVNRGTEQSFSVLK